MIDKYWRYTFSDHSGNIVKGRIAAEDEPEAKRRLAAMGITYQSLEYIDPGNPENSTVIPKQGGEIPLGALPPVPGPKPAPGVLTVPPSPPKANPIRDMAHVADMAERMRPPKPPCRREKLFHDDPKKVTKFVEELLDRKNGSVKHLAMSHTPQGAPMMTVVVEFDDIDNGEKKNDQDKRPN